MQSIEDVVDDVRESEQLGNFSGACEARRQLADYGLTGPQIDQLVQDPTLSALNMLMGNVERQLAHR